MMLSCISQRKQPLFKTAIWCHLPAYSHFNVVIHPIQVFQVLSDELVLQTIILCNKTLFSYSILYILLSSASLYNHILVFCVAYVVYITSAILANLLSNDNTASKWKLHSYWLQYLRQHHIAVVKRSLYSLIGRTSDRQISKPLDWMS